MLQYYNLMGKPFRSPNFPDYLLQIETDEVGRIKAMQCVDAASRKTLMNLTSEWGGEIMPSGWHVCLDEDLLVDEGL